MEVKWDREEEEYYIKEKIDNQTFRMGFQKLNGNEDDTIFFNIYMTLYNKRKHIDRNENLVLSTGLNPFKTIPTAIKAFNILEQEVTNNYKHKDIIIGCYWLDKKRRDVYYKFLSKRGYRYMMIDGYKYIAKKFKKI